MITAKRVFKFPSGSGKSTVTLTETDHGWTLESTARRVFEVYCSTAKIEECGGILSYLKRQQTYAGLTGGTTASIFCYYVDAIEAHRKPEPNQSTSRDVDSAAMRQRITQTTPSDRYLPKGLR